MSSTVPSLPEEGLPALPGPKGKVRRKWRTRWEWPAFDWAARNTELFALLIGVFVALCFVPHVVSFQHRDDPVRNYAVGLPARQLLESLELRLYDERFTRRGPKTPDSQGRIAIVAVDQNSLNRVGQWPWPRSLHARLIRRLKNAGASVIALDFDFSDRQFPKTDGSLSEADIDLINATRYAGNVVYPAFFDPGIIEGARRQTFVYHLGTAFSANEKGPGLDEETADLGLAYLPQDTDGGFRRYPYVGTIAGADVGGFAVLACGLYQKLITSKKSVFGVEWNPSAYEAALKQGNWPSQSSGVEQVPIRSVAFPGKDAPRFSHMYLNYYGAGGTFTTSSYADCLYSLTDAEMEKRFKGRIVFVGATAVILKDNFDMPLFMGRNVERGTGQRVERNTIPGVEIHATAASMLLEGNYITPPSYAVTLWCLFGLSMFSAVWTEIVRERVSQVARKVQERWHKRRRLRAVRIRVQDLVWFVSYGAVSLIPAFIFWNVCVYLFTETQTWVVVAYPLVSSMIASGVVLLYLFSVESTERRKIVHQVGLYMDTDILEEILAHPEEEYPRARRTVGTVMFTDLEGFTSYAESHDADEVVDALNEFMTRMSPIIRRYGGSVDKYIGDAIMAFFGVPLPRHNHAELALTCAIELQEECLRFREETGILFRMRIGLHTGELIAGSVGSVGDDIEKPHMNYTVIGDTVNLASRLEGKNKEFGSWIMCSRATFEAAPGVVEVVPALASIKGKSQDVEVFIVRGFEGQMPRDSAWAQLPDGHDDTAALTEAQRKALAEGQDGETEGEMPALPAAQEDREGKYG